MENLPYTAPNSGGQKLGDKVDSNAKIKNEHIRVFTDYGIQFDLYTDYENEQKQYTLNQIKDMVLQKMNKTHREYGIIIYVICDSYMSGIIYQIGNYLDEDFFRVYAITNGMA